MIVFRQIELAERQNFGLNFLVPAILLDSLGIQRQLLLGFIVIKNGRFVLSAPGAVGGVMFMPKNI